MIKRLNFLYHQLSVYYLCTWKNLIVNFPLTAYYIDESTTWYIDYDPSLDLRNSTCKGTFCNPNVSFVLISIILSDSVAIQETIHDFEQVSIRYDYLRVGHIFNFSKFWILKIIILALLFKVGQASKVEVFWTSSWADFIESTVQFNFTGCAIYKIPTWSKWRCTGRSR